MDIFKKIKRLLRKRPFDAIVPCAAVALLVVAAVFIAEGGMHKLNSVLALSHISPNSQAACTWGVFDCYNSSSIYSFTATPNPPTSGVSNVTISWTSSSATYYCDGDILDSSGHMVTGSGWLVMGPSGSHVYPPITAPTTYALQCNLSDSGVSASPVWTLTVYPAVPTRTTLNYFNASSYTIPYGTNATLNYSGNKGTQGTGLYLGGYGYLSGWSGSISRGPQTSNTVYSIYTEDAYYGQVGPWSLTVAVAAPVAPAPAISANPTVVDSGSSSGLTWSADNMYGGGQCSLTAPSGGATATDFSSITSGDRISNYYTANTVVGGWVYNIGGYTNTAYTTTIYKAPASSDLTKSASWSTAGSMPTAVAIFDNPLYINGNLWSFGGVANTSGGVWSSTICYVPISSNGTMGSWSCPVSLPTGAAQGHSDPVIIGDYIYRFGGYNNTTYASGVAAVARAPLSSPGSWTNYTNVLPQAMYGQTVAIIGNYVYLFGGYNGSAYLSTVYRASINSDLTQAASWSSGGSLPTTLVNIEVAVDANYAYLIGGHNGTAAVSTIYKIPLSTLAAGGVTAGSWGSAGTLPLALNRTESLVVGDKLYLMGGWQNGVYANKIFSLPFNDGLSYTSPANLPWHTTGGVNSAATWPLTANTTFALQCTNAYGTGSASATVNMPTPPVPAISANPTTVDPGGTSALSWSASNLYAAGQCSLTAPSSGATATNFSSITSGTKNSNFYSVNTVVKGWVYNIAGYNGSAYTPTIYKARTSCDLTNESCWLTAGSIPTSVALFDKPLLIGSNLWNFGGVAYNTSNWASTICYVPVDSTGALGAWSCPASLPAGAAQGYSDPVIIGDYIYRFGGYNYTTYAGPVAAVARAPLSSPGSWTNYTNVLPQAMYSQSVAVIGGYVYLLGGYSTYRLNTIYRAAISSDLTSPSSWTSAGVLPISVSSPDIAVDGQNLYLIGGYLNSTGAPTNSIYKIPLSTLGGGAAAAGSWSSAGTLPVPLNFTKSLVVGDKLYLMGGYQTGAYVNKVYAIPFNDGLPYTSPANLPWHVAGSPNSAVTWPIAANTTYALQCTNSAGSGSDSATVSLRDMCTDISGFQSALPPGCTGPTPSPSGLCIPAGYMYDGSACVPATPTIAGFFGPSRVRKGNTATLTYAVANPPAACSITGTNGFSTSVSPVDGIQGSVTTNPITNNTIFTLTCGAVSRTATVGIIPEFQEI